MSKNIYLKLFQIQEVMILHIELEIDSESSEYKDVIFQFAFASTNHAYSCY